MIDWSTIIVAAALTIIPLFITVLFIDKFGERFDYRNELIIIYPVILFAITMVIGIYIVFFGG